MDIAIPEMLGTVTLVSNTASNVLCWRLVMLVPRSLCLVLYNSNMPSLINYIYTGCILKLINLFLPIPDDLKF
jgi:hypothetical protein